MENDCVASNKQEKYFTVSLRHKKCGIINKVRQQISNAEHKFNDYSGCSKTFLKCWRNSFGLVIILAILAMAWACIIYGTVLGSALCSSVKSTSFVPLFKIPGLKWQSMNDRKLWKVF